MNNKIKTFEDYLQFVHSKGYMGTDDDMPDKFDAWMSDLDIEELIEYAEDYARMVKEEFLFKIKTHILSYE